MWWWFACLLAMDSNSFMNLFRGLFLDFSAMFTLFLMSNLVKESPGYVGFVCIQSLLLYYHYRFYRTPYSKYSLRVNEASEASIEFWLHRLYLWNSRKKKTTTSNNNNQWAQLHPDIMSNILNKLSLTESIRLRTVCKPWCSTVIKLLQPPNMVVFPWIYINSRVSKGGDETIFSFYSLSESRHISLSLQIDSTDFDYSKYIITTVNDGWMSFVDKRHQLPEGNQYWFLLNLITGTRIQPPPWIPSYSSKNIVVGPSLSFLSTLGNRCIDATTANKLIVATISNDTLVFCRSGDSTWTALNNPKGNLYVDILFCKGQLYALDVLSQIWIYEFKVGWDRDSLELALELSVLPPVDEAIGFEVQGPLIECPIKKSKLLTVRLMECCGELLLIQATSFTKTTAAAFRVFKLDKYLCQWVEMKNLQEDHLLLFGNGIKHSLPVLAPAATDSPSVSNLFRNDCIYHLHNTGSYNRNISHGFLNGVSELSVFNLEDGSCEPCFPSGSFHRFSRCNIMWFSPNLWI